MAKKKRAAKMKPRQTKEARKIAKFRRIMERALYFAEVNDSTWSDMVGAINTIQRVAILKAMDTLQSVKALEKQTKSGPDMTKMTSDTVADKIKLANQLIATGMMWDKIEKTLHHAKLLCATEDTTLREHWKFKGQELQRDEPTVTHE